MKVFVNSPANLSRAMHRIAAALKRNAPKDVKIVGHKEQAQLVVIYSIGYDCTLKEINELRAGQRYVIIQCCLRTTQRPHCSSWSELWNKAALVWSYYDLIEMCRRDGVGSSFAFYHAPLGVDGELFTDRPEGAREYGLFSSGYVASTECVTEAAEATRAVNQRMFHLGPNLGFPTHVTHKVGIDDSALASVYRKCRFVMGMRRIEGFELPAAEGLLCGARPVMFDAPHYRQWFNGWAEFIPEENHEKVVESLKRILTSARRPVTQSERDEASRLFSWPSISARFWQRIL